MALNKKYSSSLQKIQLPPHLPLELWLISWRNRKHGARLLNLQWCSGLPRNRGAMKRRTILLGFLLLLCSCTTTYRIDLYQLNKNYVTEVGSPMVVREKCWGDSYYQAARLKDCVMRQELIYLGRKGHVIQIIYKEYVGEKSEYSPNESFQQNVGYDLRQSDIISFKDIYFKVIEATEKFIEFIVIDPVTYYPYPYPSERGGR